MARVGAAPRARCSGAAACCPTGAPSWPWSGCSGRTLADEMERWPAVPSLAEVRAIGRRPAAQRGRAARSASVVHRDFKPENVFLVGDGGQGRLQADGLRPVAPQPRARPGRTPDRPRGGHTGVHGARADLGRGRRSPLGRLFAGGDAVRAGHLAPALHRRAARAGVRPPLLPPAPPSRFAPRARRRSRTSSCAAWPRTPPAATPTRAR